MSYFHTGTRTIIGAEAFHCPVRDGKEWDHLAMVIRLDGVSGRTLRPNKFIESIQILIAPHGMHDGDLFDRGIKIIGSSLTSN